MSTMLVTIVVFAAATLAALAVCFVVRDMTTRFYSHVDRRLGLDSEHGEPIVPVSESEQPAGGLDRAFYTLIEESGSEISSTAALAILIGSVVVSCAAPLLFFESLLAGAIGLLIGLLAPICWWNTLRAWRQSILRRHTPETLELLADGIRCGRNLEQAVELVSTQAPEPLNQEFAYCAAQLNLGHSPVAVMQRMSRRIPVPEFKVFATAVLVHRKAGGNLASLGDRLAESARDRLEFRGHLRAVTAGSRLSAFGLLAGSLVAVAVLWGLQPEYLQSFLDHPWGTPLLLIAGFLQLLGIAWVWRILDVHF